MKKVYVAVAAAMMIAGTATAQVKFGAEAGINLNNLADQYEGETVSNQIKTGFHAGVLADIGVSNHFSVVPALRYSMKGGQEERHYNSSLITPGEVTPVKVKNKLSYHYLELPVNVVYKTGMEGSSRFMIGAGPYIAYMVNAQNKYKVKTYQGSQEYEPDGGSRRLGIGNDADDEIKGLDYGVQAFVGYQLPSNLFFKAGSQVGFANTVQNAFRYNDPNPVNTDDFKQKNYNFFFTVGYMFGGK